MRYSLLTIVILLTLLSPPIVTAEEAGEQAPPKTEPTTSATSGDRADIEQIEVTSKSLRVIPSEPPDRHADIMGWPSEKSERQSIALELAEDSQLILKP